MITLEISWEEIKFFIALVIAGSLYGYHVYRKGIKRGWDDAIYTLEDAGVVYVDDAGDVCRVSDKEFREFQESIQYSE
jgi:hypothetical protein